MSVSCFSLWSCWGDSVGSGVGEAGLLVGLFEGGLREGGTFVVCVAPVCEDLEELEVLCAGAVVAEGLDVGHGEELGEDVGSWCGGRLHHEVGGGTAGRGLCEEEVGLEGGEVLLVGHCCGGGGGVGELRRAVVGL